MSTPTMIHEDERGRFLAVRIGPVQGKIAARFTAMDHQHGIIIDPANPGSYQDWEVSGFTNKSGLIYAMGPEFPCRGTLREEMDAAAVDGISLALDFVRAVSVHPAPESLFSKQILFLDSVLHLDDGRFLIMPPTVQDMMHSVLTLEQRFLSWDAWRHPGYRGKDAFRFSLWAWSYRMWTGVLPFPGEENRDSYGRYLSGGLVADPRIAGKGCPEGIAKTFSGFLGPVKTGLLAASSLSHLIKTLEMIKEAGPAFGNTDTGLKEFLERKFSKNRKRTDLVLRIRSNSSRIVLAGIIAVVVLSIPITVLVNKLSPPLTAGMNAREVVDAYFKALTNDDSTLLEDCFFPGVGEKLVNQTSGVEIMRKMRFAAEKTEAALDPQAWEAAGKPVVDSSNILYGPGKQTIRELSNNDGFAVYEAVYTFYSNMDSISNAKGLHDTPVTETPRKERISLMLNNSVWSITAIEQLPLETAPPN